MEVNHFTILLWVLPYIDMNQPWLYMCPASWTPLPASSPSHPSGLSQCPSFEGSVSCVELGLVIYFTYGNIICFSAILSNHPTLAFSRQHILKQRHHVADKCPYSQNYGFSISHVWMWELDHKEGWVPKNWCFQIVLDKALESLSGDQTSQS